MNEEINICFVCDDGYIVPTTVALNSLRINRNKNIKYNIFMILDKVSYEKQEIINKLSEKDFIINIINVNSNFLSCYHKFDNKSYCVANISALLKFKLSEILQELDKVLYLDGDILIKKDLYELYNTDLEGFLAAAVVDSGTLYGKNKFYFKCHNYFNSGVLLLNLKKMREENITDRLFRTKEELKDNKLMDQNIFNVVFDNQIKLLSIKYNFLMVNLIRAKEKYTLEQINILYNEKFNNFNEIEKEAVIIHYSSKDKPWLNENNIGYLEWNTYFINLPINKNERDIFQKRKKKNPLEMNIELPVIVSLTTYPKRIETIYKVINILFNQTVLVDKIVLWLAREQFPGGVDSLPKNLVEFTQQGLEIAWCEDIGAHKKYYYTMKKYPESIVITVDDDIYYSNDLVERLLKSYIKYPYAVSAIRAHLITFDHNGNIREYKEWKHRCRKDNKPSLALIATGAGGVLYPPRCMHNEVFNIEMIKKTCLKGDDLWLKMMQVMVNTPVVICDKNCDLKYIENTQETGLFNVNVLEGNNDLQLNNILSSYNKFYGEIDILTKRIRLSYFEFIKNKEIKGNKKKTSKNYILTKIKGGICCYKEHGLKYTIYRIKQKILNLLS